MKETPVSIRLRHHAPRPAAAGAPWPPRQVVLVHDWLTGMRGGEKVLEALVELFPTAELLALVHARGQVSAAIERLGPRCSLVQRLPLGRRCYRQYLPLFPFAIEQFDLDAADLVVSTSHCAAKAVVRTGRARHLCYCHTPMRYVWDQRDAYFGTARLGRPAARAARPFLAALARWDAATADRVDRFVANSLHVAGRIRRYYNRPAAVVYPPVDTDYYCPDDTAPERFFLVVSALVPYKRLDVAIEACRAVRVPLTIVGQGPERDRLARMADGSVSFLGAVPDDEVRHLYRRAQAVLLPGEEDFGMAPVEAQGCGRPVVALSRGGASETVIDGLTGVLVVEPGAAAFAAGLERVMRSTFDPQVLRSHALRFSRDRFKTEMAAAVRALAAAPPETARW